MLDRIATLQVGSHGGKRYTMSPPATQTYGYAEVEAILARFRVVHPTAMGALRGRLIHLQRVGLSAASPGTGKRIAYSYEHIARWCFSLELGEFGISPAEIARIIGDVWAEVRTAFLDEPGPESVFFVAHARQIAQADHDRAFGLGVFALGICPTVDESRYLLTWRELVPDVLERSVVINLSKVAKGLRQALMAERAGTPDPSTRGRP